MPIIVFTYAGIKQLLFFVPNAWGYVSEGSFSSYKDFLAGIFAFLSITVIDLVRRYLIMYNELSQNNS